MMLLHRTERSIAEQSLEGIRYQFDADTFDVCSENEHVVDLTERLHVHDITHEMIMHCSRGAQLIRGDELFES